MANPNHSTFMWHSLQEEWFSQLMKSIGHQFLCPGERLPKTDGGMGILNNQPSQGRGKSNITTVGCIRGSSRYMIPANRVGVTHVVDPKNGS